MTEGSIPSVVKNRNKSSRSSSSEEDNGELRRGPWTLEEDNLLINYIARQGEGRWNLLAKRSGLKRTGKSCRLRWLNYLKPDVKRGNLTAHEQLLILDLHSKWGNKWSKIAKHLPGRTDNEIKNYWRTRVQKQARSIKIDANSKAFQDIIKRIWMPRLLQHIENLNSAASLSQNATSSYPMTCSVPLNSALPLPPPPQPPLPPLQQGLADNGSGSGDGNMSIAIDDLEGHIQNSNSVKHKSSMNFQAVGDTSDHTSSVEYCNYVDSSNPYDMEGINLIGKSLGPNLFGDPTSICNVVESNWDGYDFGGPIWNIDELLGI